jgi:hypothetical protein
VEATRQRLRLLLEWRDLDTLDRYLEQRLMLIPRDRTSLRETWSKLKTLPGESIRLLEPDWLRSRLSGDVPPGQESRDG